MPGPELGELTRELDRALPARLDQGQGVYGPRQPPRFQIDGAVHPPDGIADGLFADAVLIDRRAFAQPHQRGAESHPVAELVIGPGAEEGLLLQIADRVLLVVDLDVSPLREVTPIGNGDRAALVIDDVIGAFLELGATGGHAHRPVHDAGESTKVEELLCAASILTANQEAVLAPVVGDDRLPLVVVELFEDEVLGLTQRPVGLGHGPKALAEGLEIRKHEQAVARLDGNARNEVELVVGGLRAVDVQPVEAEDAEERLVVDLLEGLRTALPRRAVGDVEVEVVGRKAAAAQAVDVAHLQVPGWHGL